METEEPYFSIVMPAYNAGRYVGEALRSIAAQTFGDYEIVAVDDGSTDDTLRLLREYAEREPRLRVLAMEEASGSAFMPRNKAMAEGRGEYVVWIDADDYVDADMLGKIRRRIEETDADIVYNRMIWVDHGRETRRLPADDVDTSRVYAGREMVAMTLLDWHVGTGGCAIRRSMALATLAKRGTSLQAMNADEIFTRYFLLEAGKVAFTDARYHYRMSGTSVTHAVRPSYFDRLETNRLLREMMKEEYGEDSRECRLARLQEYYQWMDYCIDYCGRQRVGRDIKKEVRERLRESLRHIDMKTVEEESGVMKRRLLSAGLPVFLGWLRVRDRIKGFLTIE